MNTSKITSLVSKVSAATGLMLFSAVASATSTTLAGTGGTGDAFYDFAETVESWSTGPLGIGLALAMLLMGAGYGVAKNSPMPALSGVAGGALLHWGPGAIISIMSGGAVL